ncbi:acetylxylan esterase [Phytohabitans houttuyneae]|uniref:Cephalosporin-C deacetylase n=1 Tax=Phytohabitans houttuyneae TaxID=1076126 RepID=A0A6V8KVM7_9ACTN|nr:acetylxylan esterase [Phytohabitans houttuyneae]GFJ84625.1 cephalosporin-C deacetylase [Phytohabitans houttuyneae]
MFVDMPLDQLRAYRPERDEPDDFGAFWTATLDAARAAAVPATFTLYDSRLSTVDVYDVTFSGFKGHPIKGWFLAPRGAEGPLPCVVEFIGYGGGRGLPLDWLSWSAAGYAHLVMDTRGQGSGWLAGDTPDPAEAGGPHTPGFMTRGILDPHTYYYRRLITDGVRAVETAREHPLVDNARLAICGTSQGGGIAVAVGGLVDGLAAVMPDVPFLSHYRRATEITDSAPYFELTTYCKTHRDHVEKVFDTLRYFDGVNFAAHATAPSLFSVALMDDVCPPSTVYAAYNHWAAEKDIRVWSYNGHEGGQNVQRVEQIAYLGELLKP